MLSIELHHKRKTSLHIVWTVIGHHVVNFCQYHHLTSTVLSSKGCPRCKGWVPALASDGVIAFTCPVGRSGEALFLFWTVDQIDAMNDP